jgi:peptide-methionine (S)-S-oxide reductase
MLALLTFWVTSGFFMPPYNVLAAAGPATAAKAETKQMEPVKKTAVATFAGGCFWGTQYAFEHVPGVVKTEVGFMGGKVDSPSYSRVCEGDTMHAEVVHIEFDPNAVSYRKLVEYFFKIHDPTTPNRQGPDAGTQYRSAIFFYDASQQQIAKDVMAELKKQKTFKRPIVTQLVPAGKFWKAENYHQKYFDKNPERAAVSCHRIPKFEP